MTLSPNVYLIVLFVLQVQPNDLLYEYLIQTTYINIWYITTTSSGYILQNICVGYLYFYQLQVVALVKKNRAVVFELVWSGWQVILVIVVVTTHFKFIVCVCVVEKVLLQFNSLIDKTFTNNKINVPLTELVNNIKHNQFNNKFIKKYPDLLKDLLIHIYELQKN